MVKLNADIEGNPEDVRDGIRTARVVACIIAALLFLYTALGGLSVYIKSEAPFRDSRTVWWIASGVEGTLIFIVLAVFQYRDYNDGDPIQESPFFWVIMSLVVGMLTFFILKDTCKIFGKEETDAKHLVEIACIYTQISSLGPYWQQTTCSYRLHNRQI